MSKPVYMLSVFYSSPKKQAANLARILPAVKQVSGGDYKVIQYDDRSVAYFFVSNLDHEALRNAFREILAEKLQLLIVQIQTLVGSSIPTQNALWLQAHNIGPQK